ncbi:MotA/TolQ/ExbB proton channel family protein [Burkholderia cepacia]|uniref:MotA/TolQ/ExbB proton channel family protein n=1 Tax=Burkholderia cepacia TaxID=292 RepID=UPI000F5A53C1|nr:MotA/TolQ/ExbB proton channel family protein [Burkholderia cepacia]RQT91797.1 MotA/TolQ/ExbB proton channel family protein [Burkholderia cepacia]
MQYGIGNVWQQGDFVTRFIAVVLLTMSVLSWSVLFAKSIQLIRLRRRGILVERQFWQHGSIEEAQASLGHFVANDPYTALVDVAREAADRHTGSNMDSVLGPDEWLGRCLGIALNEHIVRMLRGLTLLASIGSTAPFVGLFGTVWGIYHALLAIGAAGQSSISQVAGPVGESLVMTAFGLFVAIPAVLGYNAIARGNREVTSRLHRFQHELQTFFTSGEKIRPHARTIERPAGLSQPNIRQVN